MRAETVKRGRRKRERLVAQAVPGGHEIEPSYTGQPLNGMSLILTRYGGGGDHLFMTAVVAELKRRYPTARITVGGAKPWREVWRGSGLIENYLTYPVPIVEIEKRDYYLTYEGTLEGRQELEKVEEPRRENVYDIFFDLAGLGDAPESARVPVLKTTPAGNAFAKRVLKGRRRPVIAYQWAASVPHRTYPYSLSFRLLAELVKLGDVFLLGKNLPRPEFVPRGAFGLNTPRLEFAFGFLAQADLLVAPDSMFVHAAAALGVPTVALYGPIAAAARVRTYPKCIPVEGAAKCAPCFTHSLYPCGQPSVECKIGTGEAVGVWCKAMVIQPDVILDVVKKALRLLRRGR